MQVQLTQLQLVLAVLVALLAGQIMELKAEVRQLLAGHPHPHVHLRGLFPLAAGMVVAALVGVATEIMVETAAPAVEHRMLRQRAEREIRLQ